MHAWEADRVGQQCRLEQGGVGAAAADAQAGAKLMFLGFYFIALACRSAPGWSSPLSASSRACASRAKSCARSTGCSPG
jgi:hypothetical protein